MPASGLVLSTSTLWPMVHLMMSTGTSLSTGLWDLRHPSSSICLTCRLGYTTGPSYFFIQLVLGPLNSLVWYVPYIRYTRGLGWRIHCGVEVTESSTNKQQQKSSESAPLNDDTQLKPHLHGQGGSQYAHVLQDYIHEIYIPLNLTTFQKICRREGLIP
jgi:hypothetical protein